MTMPTDRTHKIFAWLACHTFSTPMRHLYHMYFTNQAFYLHRWVSRYMVCLTTSSVMLECASWLLWSDYFYTILNLALWTLDLFSLAFCGEMWCCVWPDPTRYLAKIDLSSHPEQDITTTPTGSTTSPQEATPTESTDPRPSTNTTPAALTAPYPLIDLINTILHNLIHHRLPSIHVRYMCPCHHSRPHSWILPLPPFTVCTPYPPPPSHRASLPQRDSYSGVYPYDDPSPL